MQLLEDLKLHDLYVCFALHLLWTELVYTVFK